MLRKINPLAWVTAFLNATDAKWEKYTKRMNYEGRHWAPGVA